jgi:short-subunit dehydrogenase
MVAKNHGMIVTVASLAGYVSAPSMVDYAASKASAVTFHEGLAAELVTHYKAPKVRTVLMCQGYTRTALFEGFDSKFLFPETVAEEIVKAVLGGKSKHMTLPETAWLIAPRLRSLPLWMQYGMRRRRMEKVCLGEVEVKVRMGRLRVVRCLSARRYQMTFSKIKILLVRFYTIEHIFHIRP